MRDYDAIKEALTFYAATAETTRKTRALLDAADAIEELVAAVPKWISAEERLPDYEESVFVVRKFLGVKGQVPPSTYVEIAYRLGDRWVADSDEYKIARHRHTDPLYWMPLPEPPKEDANENHS